MQSRQTLLMFVGLLLVLLNALVSGHWLRIKSALVSAPGSGAPTAGGNPIDSAVSGAANALKNRITSQAKQQVIDPTNKNVLGGSTHVTPGGLNAPSNRPWWWKYVP